MTKNPILTLAGCAVFGLAIILANTGCDKQGNAKITESGNIKITPANVAKLSKGMQRAQVYALFGQPTVPGDVKDMVIFKKQTSTWTEGKESLSVTFKNDEVEEFTSTVGTTTSMSTTDGSNTTTTSTSTSTKSE